ncbi:CALCIUM BINDING PROTEIN [Salix viminalis]|uniref:CALCIUM BINDING PROTEIN n=1 Tax=Salix viminalis TaxID=40686 RepID=A0A9Q0UH95_SALVM|nr:CALCIUM BINDING PROTEIN [Salix viminalis]
MAIKPGNDGKQVIIDGKEEMTMEQFKIWIKTLDVDKNGKITKDELSNAVRGNGGWFAGWKGKRGIRSADSNGDGVIDESEIAMLAAFAQKHLGIKIIYHVT